MAKTVEIPTEPDWQTLCRMREALVRSENPPGPIGMRAVYAALVAEATRPNTQTQERP